jgi:hypothetical protein
VAKKTGKSINKTIIELLRNSLGLTMPKQKMRDITGLAGTWSKEQADEFSKNVEIFEKIDSEVWDK